jgi:hypothetical protein
MLCVRAGRAWHAVLMDLRGFGKDNRGCKYDELEQQFTRPTANRTVP